MVTDAVIFDFDDTLVATNIIFENARKRFFEIMAAYGCTDCNALGEYLNTADVNNVLSKGYMAKDCFPRAMRQTYEYFICQSGKEVDQTVADAIESIGFEVYDHDVNYQDGAQELLSALQGKVRLFLLTQGETTTQQKRLDRSGVLEFFDDFRIVRNKNREEYLSFLMDMNIDAPRSWMIGNSLRSDINPALSAGLLAAHYKIPAWDFEHEDPAGNYDTIYNLLDFLELIEL